MFRYEEIAEDLQEKIKSGTYRVSDKLPKEFELCEIYDASRTTVREAMALMEKKGLIYRRRGSGSYVKSVSEQDDVRRGFYQMTQFNGFSKDMKEGEVTSKVLEFSVVNPTTEVANSLKISKDDFVYYLRRVRMLNGEAYVLETTYMPISVVSGITKDVVKGSIYSYIEDTLKLKIRSAHRIARALLATEEEKELLKMDNDICIFEVEQIGYLDDGRIFECSITHHRSDKFELKAITLK